MGTKYLHAALFQRPHLCDRRVAAVRQDMLRRAQHRRAADDVAGWVKLGTVPAPMVGAGWDWLALIGMQFVMALVFGWVLSRYAVEQIGVVDEDGTTTAVGVESSLGRTIGYLTLWAIGIVLTVGVAGMFFSGRACAQACA